MLPCHCIAVTIACALGVGTAWRIDSGPSDIPGCTRSSEGLFRPRGDAVVGWAVDVAPRLRHCWFARSRSCPDCPTGAFLIAGHAEQPQQLLWSETSFR